MTKLTPVHQQKLFTSVSFCSNSVFKLLVSYSLAVTLLVYKFVLVLNVVLGAKSEGH